MDFEKAVLNNIPNQIHEEDQIHGKNEQEFFSFCRETHQGSNIYQAFPPSLYSVIHFPV